jgi:hypothetical protein
MFKIRSAVLASAAIACAPLVTQAQSASAIAGWVGLVLTPVGAFAPVVTGRPVSGKSFGFQVRGSHWQFAEDDDNTRNIGIGGVLVRGRTRTVLELGTISKQGCSECGGFMAGLDFQVDLAHTSKGNATYLITANPALGYGAPKEGGGNVVTMGLSLPMSASFNAGSSLRFVPFVSPGFGGSRISAEGESQNGSRAMVGGGLSVGGQKAPWLVTLSARKIILEETPTIYGVGLTFGR